MTLHAGTDTIQPVTTVCTLACIWTVNLACKRTSQRRRRHGFFHLRRLRQVRRLLVRDVTANRVCAFVLSRMLSRLYANAPLAGLPYSTIAPLQRVINATVRFVYGLRSRDHATAAAIEQCTGYQSKLVFSTNCVC